MTSGEDTKMSDASSEYTDERPQCKTIFHADTPQIDRCKRPVKVGGYDICGYCLARMKHGGSSSPDMRRFGHELEVETESRRLIRELIEKNEVQLEMPPMGYNLNPFEALLDIAAEQMAFKDLCKAKLAKLREDEWRWDGDRAGEQLRSEVSLYERAIERCTNTMVKISRLGLEERMTRIAERQAAIVEMAIVRTLQELNLPLEMQQEARERVVAHLRAA